MSTRRRQVFGGSLAAAALVAIAIVLFGYGCANQLAPEGGVEGFTQSAPGGEKTLEFAPDDAFAASSEGALPAEEVAAESGRSRLESNLSSASEPAAAPERTRGEDGGVARDLREPGGRADSLKEAYPQIELEENRTFERVDAADGERRLYADSDIQEAYRSSQPARRRAATRARGASPPSARPEAAGADGSPPGAKASKELADADAVVKDLGLIDKILAGPADELWILERPESHAAAPPAEDATPGSGALVARIEGSPDVIPVPLEHTAVKAEVSGYIGTVDVTQQFHNPFDVKIEAAYVFPLPHDAAVSDFLMKIGERTIRGIIREREEARRIYQEAKREGHVASLLEEERPNIFSQKVANIEPGKTIDVSIRYFHTLAYHDGWYEFVFPMVVGPRYNPAHTSDGIAALPRGVEPGESGQATEVQYLRPGERSGHDISLELAIDAGVSIEEGLSLNHLVDVEDANTPGRHNLRTVRLQPNDSIPNKDFVYRYRVSGERIKADLLTHQDERGGFFTLMVHPPKDLASLHRRPVEFVFVLDCSGSMRGLPLAKAKRAASRALRRLDPRDSFHIIRFANVASALGPSPLAATPENVQRGIAYLDSLESSGGTEMITGIKAALDFPHDPDRLRLVSFMTDGFIGNENEIFAAIHDRLGKSGARIFSFGVGNSVNRHLLEGMARLGRGAVAYIGLDEGVEEVVDSFYERTLHPALTDVEIDWGGLAVSEVFPKRIPDLFVGRPVIIAGRYDPTSADAPKTIRIRGRAGESDSRAAMRVEGATSRISLVQADGGDFRRAAGELEIEVVFDPREVEKHPGIASVWARKQIQVLSDYQSHVGGTELPNEIRRVALENNLMSAYTSFVAVDSLSQTGTDPAATVPVPVPVPDGVPYETTVGR